MAFLGFRSLWLLNDQRHVKDSKGGIGVNNTRGTRMAPDSRYDWSVSQDGRTYYRRAGVCVTDLYLIASGRRFMLTDLRRLRTVRGPCSPIALGATVVLGALIVAIVGAWPSGDLLGGGAAGTVVVLAALGFIVAVVRARRRRYELWADYRGVDVRVLDIAGSEPFGQICRAVIRANEARDRANVARDRIRRARDNTRFGPPTQRRSPAARLISVEESSGLRAARRIASNASR